MSGAVSTVMLDYDSLNCPYCGSPTMVTERPQINRKDGSLLYPYEVVLTCTGIHKDIQLDTADYYDSQQKSIIKKGINVNRRSKEFMG